MNGWLRKYATPLSFVTFLGAGLTGMLMFFGVRGGPLSEIHEWTGVVFVVALALHLARNWRGVLAMLKTPPGMAIAGGLGVVTATLILLAAPFGGAGFHGGHQGHGPWRVASAVASAPIEKMAPALGLTKEEAVARLKAGGVPVDGTYETLNGISRDHGVPVPRMLSILLASDQGAADVD